MTPDSVTLDDLCIDCHCHVFDAATFPVETYVAICLRRWAREELGGALAEARDAVESAGSLAELRTRARELVRRWRREWVGPGGVRLAPEDGVQGGARDVAAFVLKMVAGDPEALALELLPADRPEAACAPLMMDLDAAMPREEPGALERWDRQVRAVSRLAAEHPGRAFPFFAVHPRRREAVEQAADLIARRGFWGVKVYPPLGHPPDHPRLMELYAWCEKSGAPVTAHCSPVGVWSDLNVPEGEDPMRFNTRQAEPRNWAPVLERFTGLRLNLAHFGGEWDAAAQGRPCPWVDGAVEMLKRYPNCYADLSYHFVALHRDPQVRTAYFRLLRAILDSDVGHKVLWGTDYVILRTRCGREEYEAAFAPPGGGLTPEEFRRVTNRNARRFLGLDDPPDHCLRFAARLKSPRLPAWLRDKLRGRQWPRNLDAGPPPA